MVWISQISNNVFNPRFFFDFKIFNPCETIALFSPTKGTTSQSFPRATKSKYSSKFGYVIFDLINQSVDLSSLFKEIKNINVTPAAHKYFKSDLSSNLFGFTIE